MFDCTRKNRSRLGSTSCLHPAILGLNLTFLQPQTIFTRTTRKINDKASANIFIQGRVVRACMTVKPPPSTLHLNGLFDLDQTFSSNILLYKQMFDCLATSLNKASSSWKKQPIRKRICGRPRHNSAVIRRKRYVGSLLLDV